MAIQLPYTDGFITPAGGSNFESKDNKGQANGYAPLDGNAKIPTANLPDQASLDAEVDGKITTHNSATSVHGIVNTGELIHSNAVGPNTDKIVTFNQSVANGIDSEIGYWGFGVENANGKVAYIEPEGLHVNYAGTSVSIESDKVQLDNGAKLRKGTTNAGDGGYKGIALECSAQYELKWEAGRLYTMQQDGFTIRSVEHCMSVPNSFDDDTKGYVVGTRWVMDSGKTYVCTHAGEGNADWELMFSQDGEAGNSGGYIKTSANGDGPGGYIDTSGAGGNIDTRGVGTLLEGVGGSIDTRGIQSNLDNSIFYTGGNINTSAGQGGSGGSINTSNGGGSINTRGTGFIELGVTGTRTTLNGSASGTDKTITLPNATGTIALTSHTHGNLTSDGKVGSTANLPLITTTSGVVTTGTFGTTANSFCQGNDVRLSNRAIFTLGGEEKITYSIGQVYFYGGQLTKGSKVGGGLDQVGLPIFGNWTIVGLTLQQNLPSSCTASLTYNIGKFINASTYASLLDTGVTLAGNNSLTTYSASASGTISSGDRIGLVLAVGGSGTVPTNANPLTITAQIYCVPR